MVHGHATEQQVTVTYDILHSSSYQVPVLYFTLHNSPKGSSLDIEFIHKHLVPKHHLPSIKDIGVLGAVGLVVRLAQ